MNLSIKTERKLLLVAKIQHNYNVSSTLIIGLVCGIQQVVYWYPIAGLFASLLCIEKKGMEERRKSWKIKDYFVNF